MKIKRTILPGISIWIIAVLCYSISFYVPILEDLELQANIVLFLVVIPLVWMACAYYYKSQDKTHGFKVGTILLLISIGLDVLITVPLFVIPNGGSHYSFFTDPGFWIIAFEFLIVASLYWYSRIYPKTVSSNN